jgi:hypothetical protein
MAGNHTSLRMKDEAAMLSPFSHGGAQTTLHRSMAVQFGHPPRVDQRYIISDYAGWR